MIDKLSLSCTPTAAHGGVTLRLELVNRSSDVIRVLASPRLLYLLFEDGHAVVLYGVNDPDPDLDSYGIEIPLTRPLALAEHLVVDTTLVPLVPHYEAKRTPVGLPDELEVICKAAYGDTPIDDARRATTQIKMLLAWQHWVSARPLRVKTSAP